MVGGGSGGVCCESGSVRGVCELEFFGSGKWEFYFV